MIKITALCTLAVLAVVGLSEAKLSDSEVSCLAEASHELQGIAELYPNTALLKAEVEKAGEADLQISSDGKLPIGELPQQTINDCYKLTLMFNAALMYTLCEESNGPNAQNALDIQNKFWLQSDNSQMKVQKADKALYEVLHQASYCDHYMQHKLEQLAKA